MWAVEEGEVREGAVSISAMLQPAALTKESSSMQDKMNNRWEMIHSEKFHIMLAERANNVSLYV